jgi:hypothetical protein
MYTMQLTINIMNLNTGNITQEDWTVDQAKAPYEIKAEINDQLLLQNKIVLSDALGLLPC